MRSIVLKIIYLYQGLRRCIALKFKIMKLLLFLTVFLTGVNANSNGQFKFVDSCSKFNLHIKIENPYSDTIVYRYKDCNQNAGITERVVLKKGEAKISGYINRSAEMIINCNLNAKFEDSSFFRLILEPGNITVNLIMAGANIINQVTTGSLSQNERQKWSTDNRFLLQMENKYLREFSSFIRSSSKLDSVERQKKIGEYQNKFDVLSELKAITALDYIKLHSASYFSGALLFHYKRLYTPDIIMKHFNGLSKNVQQSDFGKYILDEVFKRSNNWDFLEVYMDSASYRKLKNIKSIFDVSLTGLDGEKIPLSRYRGKILLLDFWGSWCRPCIANIPHLNQLIGELKDYPVEIISVAFETKEGDWRNTILKNNYGGIHLLDSEGILSAYYKVLGAPKYVIVGPDGTLLNNDAPYATSPLLKKTILEIITKQKL